MVDTSPGRYAYLGPAGTFSEAALRHHVAGEDVDAMPCSDVVAALDAVRTGVADRAVVPIENSIEGGVNATLDSLAEPAEPLVVVGEVVVPVQFVLAALPGTTLDDVTRVATHPHAWAQCRGWTTRRLDGVGHVPATSTSAAAAELAAAGSRSAAGYDAALCSDLSAQRYGLEVLAAGVADNPHGVTRFVVVARPGVVPAPTGADKTTVVVHLADNEAGALLRMLDQFAVRGVNLSRIESRPVGDALGRYSFSIDIEGHVTEERIRATLIGLHRVCPLVRFLGSYPRADGRRPRLAPGTHDADFVAARDWAAGLLGGGA